MKPGLHQNSRMNSIQNIRCFAANILKAHALMRTSYSEQLYLVFTWQMNLQYLYLLPVHPQSEIEENITSSLEENLEEGSSELQACAYVCGFIIKKNKISCNNCKKILVSETPEGVHNFIEFKNYENLKKSLTYASKKLIACVEKSASLINIFLEKEAYKDNIKMKITQLLQNAINYDFLEDCVEHKELNIIYIVNSVFHITIKRYCIVKNRMFSEEASKSALKRKMNIIMHK